MYLIHMPVLEIFFWARRGVPHLLLGALVGVRVPGRFERDGLVAVVLYLFVELPFHNLVMLLRKRLAKPPAPRGRRRRPRRARRAATEPVAGVGGRGELEMADPLPLFPPNFLIALSRTEGTP